MTEVTQDNLPQEDPAQEATESPFPEGHKFHGKPITEIAKSYDELESKLGSYSSEVKQLKEDLEAEREWRLRQSGGTQAQPQPAASPESQITQPVDWYEDPAKAATQTFEQLYQKRRTQEMYYDAFQKGPSIKAQARRENPEVFEGVDEKRLDQIVFQGIQSGMIHPSTATSPEGWKMAAWQLKGQESGFKFNSPSPNPETPRQTDAPPLRKPPVEDTGDEVPLTNDAMAISRALGVDPHKVQKRVGEYRNQQKRNRES